MNFKITGLEELQRSLRELGSALSSLDGTITKLHFDPHNDASINAAIKQMEEAVDERTASYQGNPQIAAIVANVKLRFADGIWERARQAALDSKTDKDK